MFVCLLGALLTWKIQQLNTGGVKKSVISVKIESEEKQKCDNR